jgi:hypothetical protein
MTPLSFDLAMSAMRQSFYLEESMTLLCFDCSDSSMSVKFKCTCQISNLSVTNRQRWAQSAMDRWIDTDTIDRCYRSILLVMLTTDSIDPSVKDFFILIDSIDHRSRNPCQTNDHRSIGSLSTDGIDPSVRN